MRGGGSRNHLGFFSLFCKHLHQGGTWRTTVGTKRMATKPNAQKRTGPDPVWSGRGPSGLQINWRKRGILASSQSTTFCSAPLGVRLTIGQGISQAQKRDSGLGGRDSGHPFFLFQKRGWVGRQGGHLRATGLPRRTRREHLHTSSHLGTGSTRAKLQEVSIFWVC